LKRKGTFILLFSFLQDNHEMKGSDD